jgi:hypothetical protein
VSVHIRHLQQNVSIRRVNELQDCLPGGGFPAATFPHKAKHFPSQDVKVHAVDRPNPQRLAASQLAE